MVWAGIHHDGKIDLVKVPGNLTAQRYCDGIIEPVVVPYLQQYNVGIFQNENARPHTTRHTLNILRIHNVNMLQWLARSPDPPPIEHLWDHLAREVREPMTSTTSVILNVPCKLNGQDPIAGH